MIIQKIKVIIPLSIIFRLCTVQSAACSGNNVGNSIRILDIGMFHSQSIKGGEKILVDLLEGIFVRHSNIFRTSLFFVKLSFNHFSWSDVIFLGIKFLKIGWAQNLKSKRNLSSTFEPWFTGPQFAGETGRKKLDRADLN